MKHAHTHKNGRQPLFVLYYPAVIFRTPTVTKLIATQESATNYQNPGQRPPAMQGRRQGVGCVRLPTAVALEPAATATTLPARAIGGDWCHVFDTANLLIKTFRATAAAVKILLLPQNVEQTFSICS